MQDRVTMYGVYNEDLKNQCYSGFYQKYIRAKLVILVRSTKGNISIRTIATIAALLFSP